MTLLTLGPLGTSLPSLDHVTVGVGEPTMGMSILIGSPALTLIALPERPDKSSFGASVHKKWVWVNKQNSVTKLKQFFANVNDSHLPQFDVW